MSSILVPVFTLLTVFFSSAHVGTSVGEATTSRVQHRRVAQVSSAAESQSLFENNMQYLVQTGRCRDRSTCVRQYMQDLVFDSRCADPATCAEYCAGAGKTRSQCSAFVTNYGAPAATQQPSSDAQQPATSDQQPATGAPSSESPVPAADESQCVSEVLNSIRQVEQYGLRESEPRIKALKREKIDVAEVSAVLEQLRLIINQGKAATGCQQIVDISNQINTLLQESQQKFQELEQVIQEKRCVGEMKRGVSELERTGLKEFEKRIRDAKRQRVAIPADITAAYDRVKTLMAEVKAATACEQVQGASQELFESFNALQEFFQKLEFLTQVPRMVKEITREFKAIEKTWNAALRRAKVSKADLSEVVAKGQASFDELKTLFDEFLAVVKSGDFEQLMAFEERGESAEEKLQEVQEAANTIQALANAPRHLQALTQRVTALRRLARNLERKDIDVTALTSCLEAYGPVLDGFREEVRRRPLDLDALVNAVESAESELGTCQDLADELSGAEDVFGEILGPTFTPRTPLPAAR